MPLNPEKGFLDCSPTTLLFRRSTRGPAERLQDLEAFHFGGSKAVKGLLSQLQTFPILDGNPDLTEAINLRAELPWLYFVLELIWGPTPDLPYFAVEALTESEKGVSSPAFDLLARRYLQHFGHLGSVLLVLSGLPPPCESSGTFLLVCHISLSLSHSV